MKSNAFKLVLIIGILGLLSSVYLLYTGADFTDFIMSFTCSIALLGTVILNKKKEKA